MTLAHATMPRMEAANIVQLPNAPTEASVRVEGQRLAIDSLTLTDGGLAAFVAERPPQDRVALVERALKVGLTALQDAATSVDVDVVRREFEGMLRQTEAANERAANQLDELLRTNFADGDGRLPRTLEAFLGDRGQLRGFVNELFDEKRRDSAIGRIRHLLGDFFDGDASRLALLLDPTRMGSPLHQFRTEVTVGFERLNERLTAIEAAATARSAERSRSSAKGADFEDLIESLLIDGLRGTEHLLDRTGDAAGDIIRSKKGDLVITLDPDSTRGAAVRIVVECKDRRISGRAMREELAEARRNRDAAIGLVVFSSAHAPSGIGPFDVRAGDVYCVIDPDDPQPATLDAAMRLARLIALVSIRETPEEIDGAALQAVLDRIRGQLDAIRGLKMQLTTIGTTATEVGSGLDRMRDGIVADIGAAEAELSA